MVAAFCVRVLVLSLFALWPNVNGLAGGEKPSAIRRHHDLGQMSPRARAAFSVYRGDDASASNHSQARPVEGYSRPRSVFSSVPRSHHQEEIYGDVPEKSAVLQSKEGMWDFPQLPKATFETLKPLDWVPKKQMPLPKKDVKEDGWTDFGKKPPQQPFRRFYSGQKPAQHLSHPTYLVDKPGKPLPSWPMLPGQKPPQPTAHPTYPVNRPEPPQLPPWPMLPGQRQPQHPSHPGQKPAQQPSQPSYPQQNLGRPTYPVDKPGKQNLLLSKLPGLKPPQQPSYPRQELSRPTYPGQKPAQQPSRLTYLVGKPGNEQPLMLPGRKPQQKPSHPNYPAQESSRPIYPGQKPEQQPSHPTYPGTKRLPPWPVLPGHKQVQHPSRPTYPVDRRGKQQQPSLTYPGHQPPSVPQSKDNTWLFAVDSDAKPRTSMIRRYPHGFPDPSLQRPNMVSPRSHAEVKIEPRSGPASQDGLVRGSAQGPYMWWQPGRVNQRLRGSSS